MDGRARRASYAPEPRGDGLLDLDCPGLRAKSSRILIFWMIAASDGEEPLIVTSTPSTVATVASAARPHETGQRHRAEITAGVDTTVLRRTVSTCGAKGIHLIVRAWQSWLHHA